MIEDAVSVSKIKQLAIATGQPVIYYFVSSYSKEIIKRIAFPNGHAQGLDGGSVMFEDADGIIRFTNYWFAYAHQCRLKRQQQEEPND